MTYFPTDALSCYRRSFVQNMASLVFSAAFVASFSRIFWKHEAEKNARKKPNFTRRSAFPGVEAVQDMVGSGEYQTSITPNDRKPLKGILKKKRKDSIDSDLGDPANWLPYQFNPVYNTEPQQGLEHLSPVRSAALQWALPPVSDAHHANTGHPQVHGSGRELRTVAECHATPKSQTQTRKEGVPL